MTSSDVWVFAEQRGGELQPVVAEVLAEARRIGTKLTGRVCAVLIGEDVALLAQGLASHGADDVILVEGDLLGAYSMDPYLQVWMSLVGRYNPAVVLFGATAIGDDLAPRLAMRLKTGLVTNCTAVKADESGRLTMTKALYGGRAYGSFICTGERLQMATIVPGVIDPAAADTSRSATVIEVKIAIDPATVRTRSLGFIKGDPRTIHLTEADLIVAFGRGLGSQDNLARVEEFADVLGASIGGSRQAVDAGWLSSERQIGQTGLTVAPKLMISCGISGSMHHTSGMKDSERIIAINTDRKAPIFQLASLSVVGDMNETIPAVAAKLKERKAALEGSGQPAPAGTGGTG